MPSPRMQVVSAPSSFALTARDWELQEVKLVAELALHLRGCDHSDTRDP
jgi:hypothetical protein